MKNSYNCYTIGHSRHLVDDFIDMLERHSIDSIVDVRSSPYSAMSPEYNREGFSAYLKKRGINYIYLGDLLGARYDNSSLLFEDGKVDFKKVATEDSFLAGIDRILEGIKRGFKISLMCSEKEPFDCHRFVLISRELSKKEIDMLHILPDKIVTQDELEDRLFIKYKIAKSDLFSTYEENLDRAYTKRNIDIAYNAKTEQGDTE